MKKVNNQIEKELSYNYRTSIDADHIINMTEYFDVPQKKPNPFAKLSPSLCVVAVTVAVLLITVFSIHFLDGKSILVNNKFVTNDYSYLESNYNCQLFYKNKNIDNQPFFVTGINQKASLFIYSSHEKDGSSKIYYDYHLTRNSEVLNVTLTINGKTYNINDYNSMGYVCTFAKNERKKINITVECNGEESTFIIEK